MSPLPRFPVLILALSIGLCTTSGLHAQPAPAANLPGAVLNASSVGAVESTQIKAFIAGHTAVLKSGSPAAQSNSRRSLSSQLRPGASGTPPAVNRAYADELNTVALQVLKSDDIRAKLNLAIVVAVVADQARNSSLEGVVLALLKKDAREEAALRIWGMKAAKGVLPPLIQIGRHGAVMDQVTALAKANISDGGLVYDAYQALTGDPAAAAVVYKPLMDILAARLASYAQKFPEEAAVDLVPINYFMTAQAYGTLSPAQQTAVMEATVNLMVHAGVEGAKNPSKAIGDQIIEIVYFGAGNVFAVASNQGHTDLANQAKAVAGAVKNAPAANVGPLVRDLVNKIKTVSQYSKINHPAI